MSMKGRVTENLTEPRYYIDQRSRSKRKVRVTCVHTTFTEDGSQFSGCLSETHHLGVCVAAIGNNITSLKRSLELQKIEEREVANILGLVDEVQEILVVLKAQTKGKW
jgi:hypothetical protein